MILTKNDKCPKGLEIGKACSDCKFMYDMDMKIWGDFESVECKYNGCD